VPIKQTQLEELDRSLTLFPIYKAGKYLYLILGQNCNKSV